VAAGVDLVGDRVRSFLKEPGHPPAGAGGHAAEPGRVADLDQVQGDRGLGLAVQIELGGEVVAGQYVPVQNKYRAAGAAAQRLCRVPDRAAGAERGAFLNVDDLRAERGAVTEAVREHLGPV